MKNPKARQPDPVSGTVAHEGVEKPMNNPMGTDPKGATNLDADETNNATKDGSVVDVLTDTDSIDPDKLDIDTRTLADGFQTDVREDDLTEGLTPMHRQNIDESRIDEVLVEDSLDEDHYPTIKDIADDDAVAHSFDDDI